MTGNVQRGSLRSRGRCGATDTHMHATALSRRSGVGESCSTCPSNRGLGRRGCSDWVEAENVAGHHAQISTQSSAATCLPCGAEGGYTVGTKSICKPRRFAKNSPSHYGIKDQGCFLCQSRLLCCGAFACSATQHQKVLQPTTAAWAITAFPLLVLSSPPLAPEDAPAFALPFATCQLHWFPTPAAIFSGGPMDVFKCTAKRFDVSSVIDTSAGGASRHCDDN